MVSYQEAFKRPFSDVKNFIIGVILGIIPIVNFLVLGYSLECAKTAMKKKFALPAWKDWGNLFVKGLLYVLIVIIYFIPLFLIAAIFFGADFFVAVTGGTGAMPVSFGFGMLLVTMLFLLTAYLLPAATVRFAEKGTFASAFDLKIIWDKTWNAEYFKVWVVMMLYYTVLYMVFRRLGIFGSGFIGWVAGVTTMTAFGEVYAKL